MAENGQPHMHNSDKRNSGSLGQTLPAPDDHFSMDGGGTGVEAMQSLEGSVAPFSLEEFGSFVGGAQPTGQTGKGQFNSDDLEFESFMFDAGDAEGVQLEARMNDEPVAEAPQIPVNTVLEAVSETSAVSALEMTQPTSMDASQQETALHTEANVAQTQPEQETIAPVMLPAIDLPVPSSVTVPAIDTNAPMTPSAPVLDAMQAALSNIEGLVGNSSAPSQYPASVADWNDQLLTSIDDFSVVLLALRIGKQGSTADTSTGALPGAPAALADVAAIDQQPATASPEPLLGIWPPYQGGAIDPVNELIQALAEAEAMPPVEETISSLNIDASRGVPEGAPEAANAETISVMSTPSHGMEPVAQATSENEVEVTSMPIQESYANLDTANSQMSSAQAQTESEDLMMPLEPVDWSDTDLPPWLQEEAADEVATSHAAPDSADQAPHEVQTFDSLSEGTWLGELVAQDAQETTSEQSEAGPGKPHTLPSLPDIPEGGLSGDALEFESFMFNQGAASALPSLPNIAQFLPAVQDMEAAIEVDNAAHHSDMQQPAMGQPEAEAIRQPEAASDEPVPFWLQDAATGEAALNSGQLVENEVALSSPNLEVNRAASDSGNLGIDAVPPSSAASPGPALVSLEGSGPEPILSATEGQTFKPQDLELSGEEEGEAIAPVLISTPLLDPEQKGNYDFASLPPIEPFDFSIVSTTDAREEKLGFSTEELTGSASAGHEPMMTTANLDVLADLLGKDRSSGVLDLRGTMPNPIARQEMHPVAQAQATDNPTTLSISDDTLTSGWLSDSDGDDISHPTTITGLLSHGSSTITDVLSGATIGEDNTIMSDFDVTPFDITELELDPGDNATGYLDASLSTDLLDANPQEIDGKIFTGTLFTRPNMEKNPEWEAPDWIEEVDAPGQPKSERRIPQQNDDGKDTAWFNGRPEEKEAGSSTGWMGTGLLPVSEAQSEDISQSAGEIEELANLAETGSMLKAHVSRFKMDTHGLDDAGPISLSDNTDSKQQTYPVRDSRDSTETIGGVQVNLETLQNGVPLFEPEMPEWESAIPVTDTLPEPAPAPLSTQPQPLPSHAGPPATPSVMSSSPLVYIEGFDVLREIVAKRPADIGAHMALAVAYAQGGHADHAMYEYHRLLQQRDIPASMLQLISDHVADMESEAGQSARFYQLRGDLLMRLGRYQEAIEEYNKIK